MKGKNLRKKSVLFLKNEMCVNIEKLVKKINTFPSDKIEELITFIELVIQATNLNDPKKIINKIYCDFEHLHGEECIHEVLDSLRHAFISFSIGGLYDLYLYQENEGWYPKVTLTDVLLPNDIEQLDDIVKIYRGCGLKEFNENSYGQAWTTSKEIAGMFAYQHYQSKSWFNKRDRIILQTNFPKKGVLFAKQSLEFEVVIDTSFIDSVYICS